MTRTRRRSILFPSIEMHRVEATALAIQSETQVAFADDAPIHHVEFAVEQRLRVALSPRTAIAQGAGVGEVVRVDREVAIA